MGSILCILLVNNVEASIAFCQNVLEELVPRYHSDDFRGNVHLHRLTADVIYSQYLRML